MKICVAGNGPTAKGLGKEIDACDCVVRTKAWWHYGAEHAGQRVDAVAWFGTQQEEWFALNSRAGVPQCEHWLSWCPRQFQECPPGFARGELFFRYITFDLPVAQLGNHQWLRLCNHLGRHPSTGIVAVMMALARWPTCELVLAGFDATIPGEPTYHDARHPVCEDLHAHDMIAEKKALAQIAEGSWLGEPCKAKLTWLHQPKIEG